MTETDALIQALYAMAVAKEWNQFRPLALEKVCAYVGAARAAWATRGAAATPGEFTEHPLGAGVALGMLLNLNFPGDDKTVPIANGHGGLQGIAVRHSHVGAGLTSVIGFWFAPEQKLPASAGLVQVAAHLAESGTVALRQLVQRDEWLMAMGRPNRGTAALVDAAGTVYAASDRFRELVAKEFETADVSHLPFTLPHDALVGEQALFSEGPLRFRTARLGNLFLLHARKPLPLDGLSPREQEIARALGNGKTFKTVARQCGIAVSTVANHASRIYKKLGIYRREDLVELLRRPNRPTH